LIAMTDAPPSRSRMWLCIRRVFSSDMLKTVLRITATRRAAIFLQAEAVRNAYLLCGATMSPFGP